MGDTPQIGVGVDKTISENVIANLLCKKHEIKRINTNSKRFI